MLPKKSINARTRWVQTLVCLVILLGLGACAPTRPPPQAQAKARTGAESSAAKPFLRIETGMHTAPIKRIAVDQQERYLVTATDDKTARVWDLQTRKLLQILRPQLGEGAEGKLYAVAISPDGTTVAVVGLPELMVLLISLFIFLTGPAAISPGELGACRMSLCTWPTPRTGCNWRQRWV